jgi:iron(III) transport system substrate-binding protein
LPADVSKVLLPIDFAKSAKERDAILTRWQKEVGR